MTRYSYGDSTDSPLTSNFLEFLSEALTFAAHVHASEDRVLAEKAVFERLKAEGNVTREQLRALGAAATASTNEFATSSPDARVKKCGGTIGKRITDSVNEEIASLDAALENERARLAAFAAKERASGRDALAKMLLSSEPPDTKYEISFEANNNRGYTWNMHASTPWGFNWGGAVELPEGHAFAQLVKLDKFVPSFEINAQTLVSGWLKKEMKVKPLELAKYFVTGFRKIENAWTLSLRDFGQGPEAKTTGYDIAWGAGGSIFVTWVGEPEAPVHELSEEDAEKARALKTTIEAACQELSREGKDASVVEANGQPFENVDDQVKTAAMLISKMAPIVREITKHSLNPNELVLRRLLGKDRREEIFVTKASLIARVNGLPSPRRALFAPLDLGDLKIEAEMTAPEIATDDVTGPTDITAHASKTPSKAPPPPQLAPPPVTPPAALAAPAKSEVPKSVSKLEVAKPAAPKAESPKNEAAKSEGSKIEETPRAAATASSEPSTADLAKSAAPKDSTNPLAKAVKRILSLAKEGKSNDAFKGYADLFRDEIFLVAKLDDQRQALRIMIHGKRPPTTDAVRDAHKSAADALADLVKQHNDAADYEMLGICQTVLEMKDAASATFAAAAAIEAEHNPGSPRLQQLKQRAAGMN